MAAVRLQNKQVESEWAVARRRGKGGTLCIDDRCIVYKPSPVEPSSRRLNLLICQPTPRSSVGQGRQSPSCWLSLCPYKPNKRSHSPRCLIDEERNLAGLECEVHKAITLVHWVATEWFAEEYVPVGLPFFIHVLLDFSSDLYVSFKKRAPQ
jgi:hypothetical protein